MKIFLQYDIQKLCATILEEQLAQFELKYTVHGTGEVEFLTPPSVEALKLIQEQLKKYGIRIIETPKNILIEKIKEAIFEMVYKEDDLPPSKISTYLSGKLHHSYGYLSNLFSETTYSSIENFIILQRIERVKQLLLTDELTVSEIAWKLNYSSVAHLSNQFKKVTGLSPSHFKQLKDKRRNPIEEIGTPLAIEVKGIHENKLTFKNA